MLTLKQMYQMRMMVLELPKLVLVQDGSEYKNEVDTLCVYLKFSGTGQRETPCMTIRGLQRLLMILDTSNP